MKRVRIFFILVIAMCMVIVVGAGKAQAQEFTTGTIQGVQLSYADDTLSCVASTFANNAVGSLAIEIPQFLVLRPEGDEQVILNDGEGRQMLLGNRSPLPFIEYPDASQAFLSYPRRFLCNALANAVGSTNIVYGTESDPQMGLRVVVLKDKNAPQQADVPPCGQDESCTIKGVVKAVGGYYTPALFYSEIGQPTSTVQHDFCFATIQRDDGSYNHIKVDAAGMPLMRLSKLTSMYEACNALSQALISGAPVSLSVDHYNQLADDYTVVVGQAPITLQPGIFQRLRNIFR